MEFWPNIIDSRMVNIKKSVYRILDKKKKKTEFVSKIFCVLLSDVFRFTVWPCRYYCRRSQHPDRFSQNSNCFLDIKTIFFHIRIECRKRFFFCFSTF